MARQPQFSFFSVHIFSFITFSNRFLFSPFLFVGVVSIELRDVDIFSPFAGFFVRYTLLFSPLFFFLSPLALNVVVVYTRTPTRNAIHCRSSKQNGKKERKSYGICQSTAASLSSFRVFIPSIKHFLC